MAAKYPLKPRVAGVDGGTSQVKVAYKENKAEGAEYVLQSAAGKNGTRVLIERMKEAGVSHIYPTGVSVPYEFKEAFDIVAEEVKDPIALEVELQAQGATILLDKPLGRRLIVGLGTGTSYTGVFFGVVKRFPIGNALGGGFIDGLRRRHALLWHEFEDKCRAGSSLDKKIGDVLPSHPMADLPLSHFNKARSGSDIADVCRSLTEMVVMQITKDIGLYSAFLFTKDIVLVGGALDLPFFEETLASQIRGTLNKTPHVVPSGKYAGAVGAHRRGESVIGVPTR